MLPTKFRFIWPSGFRGEDFKKWTSSNCLWQCELNIYEINKKYSKFGIKFSRPRFFFFLFPPETKVKINPKYMF